MMRIWIVGALLLVCAASARASTLTASVSDVCDFPVSGNNGHVIGHDVGYSTKHNGVSYFVFGDTFLDKQPFNNAIDYGCVSAPQVSCASDADCVGLGDKCVLLDIFAKNTFIASTTDTTAADCMTLSYKVAGNPPYATQLLTNQPLTECFTWPSGLVSANSSLYAYYQSYRYIGGTGPCDSVNNTAPFTLFGTGLARIDTSDPLNPIGTRLGTFFASNEPAFGTPLVLSVPNGCGGATKYVYLPGIIGPDVYLVRVPAASIESPDQYLYWGNSGGTPTWVTTVFDATPIVHDPNGNVQNNFSIAYNAYMNRFLGIYSCGTYPEGICAAWTTTAGNSPDRLTGTWSAGHRLYNCPGPGLFDCYQGFQQAQYATGSPNGKTIYVTSAKNIEHQYHVRMRAFTLNWTP